MYWCSRIDGSAPLHSLFRQGLFFLLSFKSELCYIFFDIFVASSAVSSEYGRVFDNLKDNVAIYLSFLCQFPMWLFPLKRMQPFAIGQIKVICLYISFL